MSKINLIDTSENIIKRKFNDEILFKSNALIKSNVSITSNEYKMFNQILYKCQVEKDNIHQMVAKISVEELRELAKNNNDNTPKALLKTLETFVDTKIKFVVANRTIVTTLINKVAVDNHTLDFKCYLDKELFEVLMGYKELGYSPINLKLVKNAKGYYTQRFYELFRVWSGTKTKVTYTIAELKEIFMIETGNSYDRYFNFKTKVIKPAVEEITKKLNMDVTFIENKVGRTVVSLTFFVDDKEPRLYSFPDVENNTLPPVKFIETKKTKKVKEPKKNDFVNFEGREYDFKELENALLD